MAGLGKILSSLPRLIPPTTRCQVRESTQGLDGGSGFGPSDVAAAGTQSSAVVPQMSLRALRVLVNLGVARKPCSLTGRPVCDLMASMDGKYIVLQDPHTDIDKCYHSVHPCRAVAFYLAYDPCIPNIPRGRMRQRSPMMSTPSSSPLRPC